MNNKKNRSFGGVSALILIVLIFLVFWITNQSQQRSRMFTLDEYHESVDSNQVESAVIYQDKAVPTGQVELKLKDSGEYRYVNVSNVQNEQEYLEDAGSAVRIRQSTGGECVSDVDPSDHHHGGGDPVYLCVYAKTERHQ